LQLIFPCSCLFQTVSNGAITKDKEIIPREKDNRDNEQEKENTNLNINLQNNQLTQNINKDKSSGKEARSKRKDTSKQIRGSEFQNANIPKFHYPLGQPPDKDSSEEVLLRVSQEFSRFDDGKVFRSQMGVIAKVGTM